MAESGAHPTLGGRSHAPVLPLPYHEAWREEGTPTSERLLLVSPLFPPNPAVGALRWEKFAGHFADRGWKLDVLADDPAGLDASEPGRLANLPGGTRAYGIEDPDLALDRLERRLRETLRDDGGHGSGSRAEDGEGAEAGGDRERWLRREEAARRRLSPRGAVRAYRAWRRRRRDDAWAERAAALGTSLAITVDYRAVVSSGPPHRAHRAARRIARRIGRPLVIDLRDPWGLVEALPEHLASPGQFRDAERREAACVADASLVVANTEPHREALAARHPEAADRIVTVLNGYDPEDAVAGASRSDRFRVVFTGSIYGSRDPRPFLRAAGRVARELELTSERFTIEFLGDAGSHEGEPVASIAAAEGLGEHFRAPGRLPRPEALRRAGAATVLLNLPQEARLCIPAKVYEYLQMDGRILALEREGSATARLLRGTHADIVAPDDVEAIARVLRERYEQFDAGRLPSSPDPDPELSRRRQAEVLLEALRTRCPVRSDGGR